MVDAILFAMVLVGLMDPLQPRGRVRSVLEPDGFLHISYRATGIDMMYLSWKAI